MNGALANQVSTLRALIHFAPRSAAARSVTHKPVKIPLSVPHDLNADLEAYAKVYESAHGEKQSVGSLIPYMLSAFLNSDSGFKKAKKELA